MAEGQTSLELPAVWLNAAGSLATATAGPVLAVCRLETQVTMPYVSSTNVRYVPHLPPGIETASSLKIKIGDAERITGTWPALQSKLIRFSSTHFSHLEAIVIEIEATTQVNGQPAQRTHREAMIAYNVFGVTQDQDFLTGQPQGLNGADLLKDVTEEEAGGGAVSKAVSLPNHLMDPAQGAWNASELLTAVSRSTAFHYSIHGSSDGRSIGFRGGPAITRQTVLDALGRRSWRPPMNVVVAASCWSGRAQPDTILGSYFGGAGPGTNQAALGFHECSWIVGLQDASRVFWSQLAMGKTAEDAARAARREYARFKPEEPMRRTVASVKASLSLTQLLGDKRCRLWGLYGTADLSKWILREGS